MAERPLGPLALFVAATLTAAGAVGSVAGFANGDAAVYAWQADHLVLDERVIHIGWIVAGAIGHLLGVRGAVTHGVLNGLAGGGIVLGATAWSMQLHRDLPASAFAATDVRARGGLDLRRTALPLLVGAALLPWVSAAEVDLPWMALLVSSVVVRRPAWSGLLAMAAVTVSPTTLLALPIALLARRMGGQPAWWSPALGALFGAGALAVGTLGAWAWGDRGVLFAPTPRPWRALQAWGAAGWFVAGPVAIAAVVAALRDPRTLRGPALLAVAALPMLLAPPDVLAWLPLIFACVAVITGAAPRLGPAALGIGRFVVVATTLIAVVLGGFLGVQATLNAARLTRDLAFAAGALGPNDGVVAPWTHGVRVSLLATGDPYGARWRVPEGFVRDQETRWCADPPPDSLLVITPEGLLGRASDTVLLDCSW